MLWQETEQSMVRVGWGPHLRAIVCHQTRDGRNGAEFGLISPTYNTCCFAGLHITCTKLMSRCLICLRTFAPNLRLLSQCEEARQSPHCFFGLPPTDDNPIAFVNTKANFFTHPPLSEVWPTARTFGSLKTCILRPHIA
jgi:hypothetical protein